MAMTLVVNFPPGSLTQVVHLELQVCSRIFEKIKLALKESVEPGEKLFMKKP
jgi:hypothetical protein